jgi:ubiquinone/menaquinone biosynthesis C-methylase UbiE
VTSALVRRVARRVARLLAGEAPAGSPVEAWDRRAREHGARAVFNLTHTEAELAQVTEMQRQAIHPHVRAALRGGERLALDFGCGPGRFTGDLAAMIHGRAIGIDTTRAFVEMAPRGEGVEYRVMEAGRIPVSDAEVDLLWVCLVLGGIVEDDVLSRSVAELDRVLKPGALLVVIENTSEKTDAPHWRFRSVDAYRQLLSFATLQHKGDYEDVGERISILIGRKAETAPAGTAPR